LALTVLQVLALDIGTDTLPAVALGAEPPRETAMAENPTRGHLLNRRVAVRAFATLGPTEALVSLLAFVSVFVAAGWRPGEAFPEGDVLLGASGAAFAAVVFGQGANAFACRSATKWPGAIGWATNPWLLGAVAAALGIAAVFLFVPAVADLLRHEPPPLIGWVVATAAIPSVLLSDTIEKRLNRSSRRRAAGRPPERR
jgi:magnesium-transporting ATPase (P-type)